MLKIKMVRCYVTSPYQQGDNPEGNGAQVRYIPSDIFRLWKYLMVFVKGFTVEEESHSFWMDREMYSKESPDPEKTQRDEVVQVYFRYFKETESGRPVIRYFPDQYLEKILSFFMKNFSTAHIRKNVKQTKGYFIVQL